VRFNRVPEKIPEKLPEKVPEKNPVKVWEALVQRQVRLNRVPEKFPEPSGRFWCRSKSGSIGFR